MKTMNNTKIIGIDHGYGNMKTANHYFPSGILSFDAEPLFTGDMLTYNGKYYLIGKGHKEFIAEKVNDEDYYILTLAAIAKELKTENITEAHIVVVAGLPLTWTSGQKTAFREYLMKNTEVDFTYKKTAYHIYIDDVRIYPQGYAALRYAENDNKTDRQVFVCGINCSKQNAYAEMIAVQRRFGLRGKVVGYHGIQSFREGEVTPEQAFEIGKETARRMWGDKYQVLVTVHLNTDNIHCHFVVNPVSFKDGTKFHNKIGDHKELRRVSDQICREYGLSVLENIEFYSKGKKKEYWAHKAGKKTHRDYLREDVEYCLSFATNPGEFESQLYALGYTLDPVRFSVKAKHWERSVRLANIGFTKERVNKQLRQNAENRYRLFTLEYKPPYRPKRFPLEDELRRLDFAIDHSYDAAAVLVDTVFYLVITVIRIVAELADVMLLSPDLRAAEKDLKELIADYHFL